MPTTFTHLFAAGALGKAYTAEKMPTRFWVLAAVCSVIPDIDVIGYYYGIRYQDLLGHRGFFHSLIFAALLGLLVVSTAFPAVRRFSRAWWNIVVFFFLITASHGILDSMTDKGMGVGFFVPFDDTRYFMPWRPIVASPMRISRFFSVMGLEALVEEIVWIWTPLLAICACVHVYRKRKRRPAFGQLER